MKPNIFQKGIIFIYILLIVVCAIFFIPYKIYNIPYNNKYGLNISYGPIWSQHDIIDYKRLILEIFFGSIIFVGLLILFRGDKKFDFNSRETKKNIKKETLIFLSFTIIVVLCFLLLIFYRQQCIKNWDNTACELYENLKRNFLIGLLILAALIYPVRLFFVYLIKFIDYLKK